MIETFNSYQFVYWIVLYGYYHIVKTFLTLYLYIL